ncbi:unnamed protein product [Rotaria sp. Silwood2]|nr:unnamed protein product [Rotaria sp. Silwood2]
MKIIFEHRGKKTTVIGNDYDSIAAKIRSLYPDENDKTIQFYDHELSDYFTFTSFEQIQDQPNGIKMSFILTNILNNVIADNSLSLSINENSSVTNSITQRFHRRRIRKKQEVEPENRIHEAIVLPPYCDLIVQGLKTRESFPSIQKVFLEQTCAHLLNYYPESSSKSFHYSFVLALCEKFPALNYLNKDIDGKMGRAPHHTISRLLSRKKRNSKYYKCHPVPKRIKSSTIESNNNFITSEQVVVEEIPRKEAEVHKRNECHENSFSTQSSFIDLNGLLNDSTTTGPVTPSSNISNESTIRLLSTVTTSPPPTTVIPPPITPIRRATISMVPSSTTGFVNVSSIDTTSMSYTLPLAKTAPTNLMYRDGRIHLSSVQPQSIIALHKAVLPREKKTGNKHTTIAALNSTATTLNCTTTALNSTTTTTNSTATCTSTVNDEFNVLRPISIDNTIQLNNLSSDHQVLHFKVSNHKIRHRKLSENIDADFTSKVLHHQEIFHEEALIFEYSLMKNQLFSYEELQNEARQLLDEIIRKYSIQIEHHMSETDFKATARFCDGLGEQNIFFKNGITGIHPIIGVLLMPSIASGFEKAFLFVKNLPFKMAVSISVSGLHKILTLLAIVYMNLNHSPTQTLLKMLIENCKKKKTEQTNSTN